MADKILVVDDEEDVRTVFLKYLSRQGYACLGASGYQEALAQLDAHHFDLIFSDILLGGKTGLDLLHEIRRRQVVCPVIMVTGYPNMENVTEALRLGAFDFLTKPVLLDNLQRVSRAALAHYALVKENHRIHNHMEAILRSVQDPIITVDQELRITEMNAPLEKLCGFNRQDSLGRSLREMSSHCIQVCQPVLEQVLRTGQPVSVPRMECRHHDRSTRILSVQVSPLLDENNVMVGTIAVMNDETRILTMEQELLDKRQFHRLVGKSEKMQRIYTLIEQLADTSTTVLITGESGTGKELVAEAVHNQGSRGTEAPMVKVNCSALTDTLLESELFGHVKGAFTGALRNRVGRFEMAHGGTMFLDEIGDISLNIQLKLLRVIQEREFERVGDAKPIKVDFRLIAATNKDLRRKVEEGTFRQDLFYRLNVVPIVVPPLRERREDIPLLVEHCINRFNRQFNKSIRGISHEVRHHFMKHPWLGNIRELEHALEHAFIICQEEVILMEHLPPDHQPAGPVERELNHEEPESHEASREEVLEALERARWNKTKAATLLGVSRRTIYRWMVRLEIPVD